MGEPLISVVIPVHNEEEGLSELAQRLTSSLADVGERYEVLYVDDGSTDRSAELIESWADADDRSVLVQLSRNFGMEIAMTAGLDHARGSYVVIMHADLQDPPELIPQMLALARAENADVIYTRRIGSERSTHSGSARTARSTASPASSTRSWGG